MKRVVLSTLMGAAMLIATAPKADAALVATLTLCQVACTPFTDGDNTITSSPSPLTIGDYSILLIGGVGSEQPGFAQSQTIELQVQRVTDTSGAPLVAWLTVTGYTQPGGNTFVVDPSLGVTRSGTGGTTSEFDFDVWISLTNLSGLPPAGSIVIPNLSCTPSPLGGASACADPGGTSIIAGSNLYSITTRITINSNTGDRAIYGSTGQVTVTAVPEPGSMMLLGTGLLGLAAAARRRYAKK